MHIVFTRYNLVLALIGLLLSASFALQPKVARAQAAPDTIRIALIPLHSYLGNKRAYGPLIQELENETGLAFEWVQSETYDETIEKLRTRLRERLNEVYGEILGIEPPQLD